MTPVSPVIVGLEEFEVTFAKDQPEYLPLPAFVRRDTEELPVTSRWRLNDEERLRIAEGADVVLTLSTYGSPLQPIVMEILYPAESPFCYAPHGV